jgi:hypothetical protein
MSLGLRLVAQQATYLLMLVNEGQASYPARWFDLFTATAAGFQPTATDAAVVDLGHSLADKERSHGLIKRYLRAGETPRPAPDPCVHVNACIRTPSDGNDPSGTLTCMHDARAQLQSRRACKDPRDGSSA